MAERRVLLTGGSGFIGHNIRESFLKDAYRLVCPTHQEVDWTDTDSVDRFFEREGDFSAVIHAAVKPGHRNARDLSDLFLSNTRMFFNLLRHEARYEKFLNLGSGAVYDMRHYIPKMGEDYFGTYIPQDEHGYTKYVCYHQMQARNRESGRQKFVDLRIFGIYGKYEDYAIRFISNAICKSLSGLPITLRQNRVFDYLYVDDLMEVLDFFLQNEARFPAYNITPVHSSALLEIAEIVRKKTGQAEPVQVAAEGMGMEYSGNSGRFLEEYGKQRGEFRFTGIQEGIDRLLAWYGDHLSEIDRGCLLVDK